MFVVIAADVQLKKKNAVHFTNHYIEMLEIVKKLKLYFLVIFIYNFIKSFFSVYDL